MVNWEPLKLGVVKGLVMGGLLLILFLLLYVLSFTPRGTLYLGYGIAGAMLVAILLSLT